MERGLTIFMQWDMEGVSGLESREQVWFWEKGVRPEVAEEGRRLLVADSNSAAEAALGAGADRLIVCDTHRGGGNIRLPEMLADPRITYLDKSRGYDARAFRSSWPRATRRCARRSGRSSPPP
jgi:D-aminopeptidase